MPIHHIVKHPVRLVGKGVHHVGKHTIGAAARHIHKFTPSGKRAAATAAAAVQRKMAAKATQTAATKVANQQMQQQTQRMMQQHMQQQVQRQVQARAQGMAQAVAAQQAQQQANRVVQQQAQKMIHKQHAKALNQVWHKLRKKLLKEAENLVEAGWMALRTDLLQSGLLSESGMRKLEYALAATAVISGHWSCALVQDVLAPALLSQSTSKVAKATISGRNILVGQGTAHDYQTIVGLKCTEKQQKEINLIFESSQDLAEGGVGITLDLVEQLATVLPKKEAKAAAQELANARIVVGHGSAADFALVLEASSGKKLKKDQRTKLGGWLASSGGGGGGGGGHDGAQALQEAGELLGPSHAKSLSPLKEVADALRKGTAHGACVARAQECGVTVATLEKMRKVAEAAEIGVTVGVEGAGKSTTAVVVRCAELLSIEGLEPPSRDETGAAADGGDGDGAEFAAAVENLLSWREREVEIRSVEIRLTMMATVLGQLRADGAASIFLFQSFCGNGCGKMVPTTPKRPASAKELHDRDRKARREAVRAEAMERGSGEAPNVGVEWSTGLFDCLSDMPSCLDASLQMLCCDLCLVGQAFRDLESGDNVYARELCCQHCRYSCVAVKLCRCDGHIHAAREQTRYRYFIKDDSNCTGW